MDYLFVFGNDSKILMSPLRHSINCNGGYNSYEFEYFLFIILEYFY